ncbi:uncharacterized protein LOC119720025 isoform X2 [Patiria miniata]|uniref:Uncharacterized protein n=1 Tax=Patiria miniata TaxID=46514 RepID=A0A913Z1B0_PATMI|nr:uncharacterized protein LOC119720025 isoform X2 [Patiria miniata]
MNRVGSPLHVSRDVQTYFKTLESRQCRTSSVGPAHTLRVEQRIPVVRSDGQDSGVEDLGMASPGSPGSGDLGTKTTLNKKEFMVYKRALLCAQFPVLSAPQPTSQSSNPPSPYAYPLSPPMRPHSYAGPSAFPFRASRSSQARLTSDNKVSMAGDCGMDGRSDEESEEEVLVQNEMLAGLVRKAFQLNEERHRYYDEVITEGLSRKAPARILIEELVSRLSVVENNKHPFYHPQAFEPRAYDIWQQGERRHIGELIESFWQFSLPSPATSMVKPSYWQSVHEEYRDLMVRLIRLDKRQGVNSYSASMLTSTSRRLLKEFGLRYGVGELYRRIVFLEYIATDDHFEYEVWYMEMNLKELSRLSMQLPLASFQARFVMVRQEFELLQDVLSKLHEHSKHGLQGLLQSPQDSSYKAVALVNLLSSVLNLKVQLTGRKGNTLEHYLEGYIKESAKQAYHRHKLRLETELNINTYVNPITAELVARLVGCAQEDVQRCLDYYHNVFNRYKQNIVRLAAATFYSSLMADVNIVCEMSDVDKELHCIDQELLALAQRLSELDAAWKDYIPRQAQQWRQPMLVQAKSWLKTMTKQLTLLVVRVVDTDKFTSDFSQDTPSDPETSDPKPVSRQTSILRHSPFSAFTAVSSSVERSPDRVRGPKSSQANTKHKSRKATKQAKDVSITKPGAGDGTSKRGSVLYMNAGSSLKRTTSMPEIAHHESLSRASGLRRNATADDLQQADNGSEIRFQNVEAGVVSYSPSRQLEPKTQDQGNTSSTVAGVSHPKEADVCTSGSDEDVPSKNGKISEMESSISARDVQVTTRTNSDEVLDETQKDKTKTSMDSLNNNSNDEDKNGSSPSPDITVEEANVITSLSSEPSHVADITSEQDSTSRTETSPGPERCSGTETRSSPIPESTPSVETSPSPDRIQPSETSPDADASPHPVFPTNVVTTERLEIEVLSESCTDSSKKDSSGVQQREESTSPAVITTPHSSSPSSPAFLSAPSSAPVSRSSSDPRATSRAASVSFKRDSVKPEDSRPAGFSSSLVDVMFMTQRIIGFMQKLIGILCPADVEIPLGPDGDFTGSFSVRSFFVRVGAMKTELKEITEEAIIKLLSLYANNLLAMDLCATEKDQVDKLVESKVLHGVLLNRQESMLSRCRHEKESNLPCDYYTNRDTALLCDKHEPITRKMCVRINNTWSILCLLPQLASMLQSRLRGRPPSPIPSDDDLQNRIYDEPIEHADIEGSTLAEGEHKYQLNSILQAQIELLAYKLNLVLQQALHVLLSPEFDDLAIADRLQPLTSCLFDHREALGRWLTPPCLALFMQRLWLCLVRDFEQEVEGLRSLREQADSQALLLSRSISHLIEFLHAKGEGLGIDQLVKPAELVLNMLQLHSLSSKNLIRLYQKQLNREIGAEASSDPLPPAVLQTMYQALHKQRKCFTGHHMVMWLMVHYFKAQEQPASKRIKYKHKAQQVAQNLLDQSFIQHVASRSHPISDVLHDDIGFSSDTSVTDTTPYPVVTIDSVPKTSISRRHSQDLANDSSEDSLEASAMMQERRRHTKRRISDFYSEEMESSDDSSTSKSEEGFRRTIVLKADVHVSATVDSDDAVKQDALTSSSQLHSQDSGRDASPGEQKHPRWTSPPQSQPKTPLSRKLLRGAFSRTNNVQPSPSSSSSSSKQESSSLPSRQTKPPESRHLFAADTQHFYYFCDVDDLLFYSVSGDFTRSTGSGEERSQFRTGKPSDKPHPHLKHPVANAEFLLGILLCRRRNSRTAREFARSVPDKFWEEESSSPCCNCFQ